MGPNMVAIGLYMHDLEKRGSMVMYDVRLIDKTAA